MKTVIKTILVLLILFQSVDINAQLKESEIYDVFQTYGFIKGQEFTLDRIKKEFPDLTIDVRISETSFNAKFGKSAVYLKEDIIQYLGKSTFNTYKEKLNYELRKALMQQKITRDDALFFIEEVKSRAKGNIPSPMIEYLLYYEFKQKPHQEFLHKNTQDFFTKEHSKSKGSDVKIKVPKSWKAEEGNRPNVIQKFTNRNGNGTVTAMLLIKKIPNNSGVNFSKDEMEQFFTESEMKKTLPKGAKFISFRKQIFDNHEGGKLEYYQEQVANTGMKIGIRVIQNIFIYKDKMYTLQCSVGGFSSSTSLLDMEMKQYRLLFDLIANSLVEFDQYR